MNTNAQQQKQPLYVITGIDRDNKRFRIETYNQIYAEGINVWRGSKWVSHDGGKTKKLLYRVYNW